jgi:hypothetical protein
MTTITEIVTNAEAIAAMFYDDGTILHNEDGDDIILICKNEAVTITTVRNDRLYIFPDGSGILVADDVAWDIAVQDDGVWVTGWGVFSEGPRSSED